MLLVKLPPSTSSGISRFQITPNNKLREWNFCFRASRNALKTTRREIYIFLFSSHKVQFIANINVNFISFLFKFSYPTFFIFLGIIWLFSSHHQLWIRNTKTRRYFFWRIDCKMIRQLVEFLELDLINAINEATMTTQSDGSNQHLLEADLEAVAPKQEEGVDGDE